MIKKLQRKFIMITAVSLLAVLIIVAAAINVINSYHLAASETELLQMLTDNGGNFPDQMMHDDKPPFDKPGIAPGRNEFFGKRKQFNEETRFQTRFFVVCFDVNGSVSRTDISHIAAVDAAQARDLAMQARDSGSDNAMIGDYRFAKSISENGEMFVFLDCHQNNLTRSSFLLISVLISAASWVLVLVLIALLSRLVMKPFVAAQEKQKQFITDAGHEIKTPLAIISANTEVIEMTSSPSEWTESTKNQIRRLDGLVKDLVRLTKTDETGLRQEFCDFDLSKAVRESAAEFEAPARTHELGFALDIADGIVLNGSEQTVRQTVGIFCDNAIKYCDAGGSITVSLKPSHKGCKLSVTNTCAQPPKGDLSRLFDRFYRADEARERRGSGGYGIGLSIAKATADAHKAKISCSAENGAITFSVTFKTKSVT